VECVSTVRRFTLYRTELSGVLAIIVSSLLVPPGSGDHAQVW
jgi:hypothetical protein